MMITIAYIVVSVFIIIIIIIFFFIFIIIICIVIAVTIARHDGRRAVDACRLKYGAAATQTLRLADHAGKDARLTALDVQISEM